VCRQRTVLLTVGAARRRLDVGKQSAEDRGAASSSYQQDCSRPRQATEIAKSTSRTSGKPKSFQAVGKGPGNESRQPRKLPDSEQKGAKRTRVAQKITGQ
jgi:hypothetical protein